MHRCCSYETSIACDSFPQPALSINAFRGYFFPRFIWVILVWQDLHWVASKYIQFNHVVLTNVFTWVKLKWDSSLAQPKYRVYNLHWQLEGSCKSRSKTFWGLFLELHTFMEESVCVCFTWPLWAFECMLHSGWIMKDLHTCTPQTAAYVRLWPLMQTGQNAQNVADDDDLQAFAYTVNCIYEIPC